MYYYDKSALVSLFIGCSSDEPLGGRLRKLSLGQYDNDAGGQISFSKCGWGKAGADPAPSLAPFPSQADIKEVCARPCPYLCSFPPTVLSLGSGWWLGLKPVKGYYNPPDPTCPPVSQTWFIVMGKGVVGCRVHTAWVGS
jgi:hypothetical protein